MKRKDGDKKQDFKQTKPGSWQRETVTRLGERLLERVEREEEEKKKRREKGEEASRRSVGVDTWVDLRLAFR